MYAHPTMPTGLCWFIHLSHVMGWLSLKKFQPYPQTPKHNYGNKSRICQMEENIDNYFTNNRFFIFIFLYFTY